MSDDPDFSALPYDVLRFVHDLEITADGRINKVIYGFVGVNNGGLIQLPPGLPPPTDSSSQKP